MAPLEDAFVGMVRYEITFLKALFFDWFQYDLFDAAILLNFEELRDLFASVRGHLYNTIMNFSIWLNGLRSLRNVRSNTVLQRRNHLFRAAIDLSLRLGISFNFIVFI